MQNALERWFIRRQVVEPRNDAAGLSQPFQSMYIGFANSTVLWIRNDKYEAIRRDSLCQLLELGAQREAREERWISAERFSCRLFGP